MPVAQLFAFEIVMQLNGVFWGDGWLRDFVQISGNDRKIHI